MFELSRLCEVFFEVICGYFKAAKSVYDVACVYDGNYEIHCSFRCAVKNGNGGQKRFFIYFSVGALKKF